MVLQACDTAAGEVRVGEGVFGLRRACLQAGARTLVSLFPVPPEETWDFMKRFYGAITPKAAGPAAKLVALNDAKRDLLHERKKKRGASHPFYWSGFIVVGDMD
jgi:CHAT domain-containing protein